MRYFTKQAETARKLDQNFQRQIDLMVELATAYVAMGKPVPPEVGEALGELGVRQREWALVRKIYVEQTSGIGVKEIVRRFLEKGQKATKALELLSKLQEEVTNAGDQSSSQ